MNGTTCASASHRKSKLLPRTLFEKIWDAHLVRDLGDGWALLHIDQHLLHDLSGPPSLAEIAKRGLKVRNPELTFGGWHSASLGMANRKCEGVMTTKTCGNPADRSGENRG